MFIYSYMLARSSLTFHVLSSIIIIIIIIIILTRISCRREGASADKLHVKAAKFLLLVGLARLKQYLINRGHDAQYLYRPPPAGACNKYRSVIPQYCQRRSEHASCMLNIAIAEHAACWTADAARASPNGEQDDGFVDCREVSHHVDEDRGRL